MTIICLIIFLVHIKALEGAEIESEAIVIGDLTCFSTEAKFVRVSAHVFCDTLVLNREKLVLAPVLIGALTQRSF